MARAPAVQEIEELPEADRLEGFPHPRMTERLFGHVEAERILAEAFHSSRLHHGWLLTGADGIGKATLAYRFARFLLASPSERVSPGDHAPGGPLDVVRDGPTAHQVRALSHPALLVIRRGYDQKAKRFPTTIAVEEVRRLKAFLARTVEAGTYRAVIVDRADELNINAANALLKSLEEPPVRTIFLLVSSAPGRLLTTIRSRVRTLDLSPLASDPLRRAVTQAFVASGDEVSAAPPSASEWDQLERLAGGSVRRLIALHSAKGLALFERMSSLVKALPKPDWGQVHSLGDELQAAAAEPRFELFFELLMDHIARLIRARTLGAGEDADLALGQRLIGEGRLATWAGLWERVAVDRADAARLNLDRKALILETFARLEAAAKY